MAKGIGKEFMEKTQCKFQGESEQAKGMPMPLFELGWGDSDEIINLPPPESIKVKDIGLREAIERRRSVRKYSDQPLKLDELTYLLWCTQGIQKMAPDRSYRTVPSAGGRHAFETYLLVNNVEGLPPGLYRYLPIEHKLAKISSSGDISDRIAGTSPYGSFIKMSAVTFIWTAVFYRMTWRHGERGYRYIHLDAGHVCQNLYLAAESLDCGACAIGVFSEDELNNALSIDGESQSVLYMATVGKKISEE